MKLSQVIALEKETKTRGYGKLSELNKLVQKNELFNGLNRVYKKKDDNGEDFPPENKKVQLKAEAVLNEARYVVKDALDYSFTKDWGNCEARADIQVGDEVIVPQVPVTTLLTLEKHFTDIRTFIGNLPVLDASEDWTIDREDGLYKTSPTQTHRTKKLTKSLVLIQPTKEHPGQAQTVTEDEIVGYWNTSKVSGALSENKKKELLGRVEQLIQAIKSAREEANCNSVKKMTLADNLYSFILGV